MICEKCGKEHDGSFGSGRFCCRACANSRKHSSQTKTKIQSKLISVYRSKSEQGILNNDLETRICAICGKPFQIKHKYIRKCCSLKCTKILRRNTKIAHGTLQSGGGYRENANKQYGGYYKGQWCDSRWELAFLIYHLDKHNNIHKCNESFTYTVNNKQHNYYPDFKIGKVYYEIKGRWRQNLQLKLQCVRDKGFDIILIDRSLIKPYLQYCYNKYQTQNLEILYDAK